jgi:hypothetical protein
LTPRPAVGVGDVGRLVVSASGGSLARAEKELGENKDAAVAAAATLSRVPNTSMLPGDKGR